MLLGQTPKSRQLGHIAVGHAVTRVELGGLS
jgi:hypothetical protein